MVPFWMDNLEGIQGMERCVAYLPQLQLRHRKVQKIVIKSEEKLSKEAASISTYYQPFFNFQYENFYIE